MSKKKKPVITSDVAREWWKLADRIESEGSGEYASQHIAAEQMGFDSEDVPDLIGALADD